MAIASIPEEQHCGAEEAVCTSDIPFQDLASSYDSGQQMYKTEDESGTPTDVESSTGSSEKVTKPVTNRKACLTIPTVDGFNSQAHLTKPALYEPFKGTINEKTLDVAESLLKDISSNNCATPSENPVTPSIRCYNGSPFSQVVSNGIVYSPLSKESGFIKKFQVLSVSEKSGDAEIAPSSLSTTTGIINLFNDRISPVKFPINFPVSKKDSTLFATEITKAPDVQQEGHKIMKAGTSKSNTLVFDSVMTNPRTPYKPIFSNLEMPPIPSPKTNSSEMPKPLYKAIETPVLVDINSDKTLSDFLLILENWGRKGLNKALNMPITDIEAHFSKDLQYGLYIMKEMITRLRSLMTAANNLPNPHLRRSDRGRNGVRGDLISAGIAVWLTIGGLELSIIQAIKSNKTSNITATKRKNIITELFNNLADKLSLLSREIKSFRDTIRIFCSEMERYL